MLEQDTVLTIPPWAYYAVRLLEIGAMFAVGGRWLDWDLESAQNLFEDDGLVIAGFLTSTLVMFLLAIVIRTVLSVRTLLDSPVSDIWSGAEFNNVQHALKNRILKDHDTDRDALGLIMRSAEQLELKCKSHWESEAATLMSMVLVHEDTYRSPLRFAQHVRVGSGLEVADLA
ncbi:hypothetical protein AK812_SmicGene31125 [Symbiodinium microadriaticum]|uniref:Uncharacterized protein n=1 Tax=Symbiodinium microadriaticum TaxID=2951 RepID=A0A1Q9CXH3_SYMMI|nr:hypothetical protein AK812_SmicGene31125 [Symbiodinium microadriaticum]CAE7780773.1 unnamed protein product [Symbiodinium sp. KB8]